MPLQPLSQRVAEDLVALKADKEWSRHQLPVVSWALTIVSIDMFR
jgi:hypothetical protein